MRVTITLAKKSYAVGALEEIVKASAERVEPACPVYKECGGCQLQHLSYKGQLACKRQQVQDALTRIGHLELEALPVLGAAEPWSYRNKMQFPAAADAEGVLQIGCYAAATHSVVDTDACMISKEANNAIMKTVRTWMQHYNISAYDEKTGKGLVRHIMGRGIAGHIDNALRLHIRNRRQHLLLAARTRRIHYHNIRTYAASQQLQKGACYIMTKQLKLPVGIDSFEEIRKSEFYYVDKTKLVEQLLENWGAVNLFTRPRRFGKTLNMSMLKCFPSIRADNL